MSYGHCPTCCQKLPIDQSPTVDLDNNVIVAHGRSAKLQPRQAEIAYALVERFPSVASHDRLCAAISGAGVDWTDERTISVHICHMRKIFEPLGLSIINVRKQGFRLVDHRS